MGQQSGSGGLGMSGDDQQAMDSVLPGVLVGKIDLTHRSPRFRLEAHDHDPRQHGARRLLSASGEEEDMREALLDYRDCHLCASVLVITIETQNGADQL
jgi:hypothetical protein